MNFPGPRPAGRVQYALQGLGPSPGSVVRWKLCGKGSNILRIPNEESYFCETITAKHHRKDMKLAEALNQRADLQRRIAQLRERLSNNVKVQEGDQPAEKPDDLFKELAGSLKLLKDLIVSINRTNQETVWQGKTLTEIIAEKDTLSMHIAALRSALDAANVRSDRYSRNEIKFVRTIDVNALQKRVDDLSRDLRQLDSQLQQANWMTDLK